MNGKKTVRAPSVAGMFYDDSPNLLKKNIEELLKNAQVPQVGGIVRGIVSPHAGYMYSGLTAAHAYKILKGNKYECVIAVGPSHREYFDGISVYPGDAYRTPIGEVPVNDKIRSELLEASKVIVAANEGHRLEHSIEVQLPFLQSVLDDLSFVPVIMGDQRRGLCNELSDALIRIAANRSILFVASSDLSHYHPSDEAIALDKRVVREIENFDPDEFINELEEESFEACGGGPIAVIMRTVQKLGANKVEVLHYCNSGDITGEKRSVVGYLAAAFFQTD